MKDKIRAVLTPENYIRSAFLVLRFLLFVSVVAQISKFFNLQRSFVEVLNAAFVLFLIHAAFRFLYKYDLLLPSFFGGFDFFHPGCAAVGSTTDWTLEEEQDQWAEIISED